MTLIILIIVKKIIFYIFQTNKKRKDNDKIIYEFRNTLPKNKIEIKLFIHKLVKKLNNFSWFLQFRAKKLLILKTVINIILVL